MMSSTPGLELSVINKGVDVEDTQYDWSASYGQFLSWNPPDFKVNEKGARVTTNGGKIYWSFRDQPADTTTPVTITVVVRTVTGKELGRSIATLDWDGKNAVLVKEIV